MFHKVWTRGFCSTVGSQIAKHSTEKACETITKPRIIDASTVMWTTSRNMRVVTRYKKSKSENEIKSEVKSRDTYCLSG